MLKLEAVSKAYPGPEGGEDVAVLSELSLEVAAGESVGVVGPSGSGKSTLLNLIGALDTPSAGRVLLDDVDLATLDEAGLAALRAKRIGFIFQSHHLLPQCSVIENVLLPTLALPDAPPAAERRTRAEALLERVGLAGRITHRPGQLSGGERQRVAVARALINGPGLLLADEPTGSLDRATSDRVSELLLETLAAENLALVLVTHDPTLAARMSRTITLGEPVGATA